MAIASMAVDTLLSNGVKKRSLSFERYNPWTKILQRHEAARLWRYRTARILTQNAQDLPVWVKDNVDWPAVSLIYEV